jgi:hypothetical protein
VGEKISAEGVDNSDVFSLVARISKYSISYWRIRGILILFSLKFLIANKKRNVQRAAVDRDGSIFEIVFFLRWKTQRPTEQGASNEALSRSAP